MSERKRARVGSKKGETKWNECQDKLGEPVWPDKAGRDLIIASYEPTVAGVAVNQKETDK